MKFKIKIMSSSQNDIGGFKEVVLEINGDGAYGTYKYEGGTHRVQQPVVYVFALEAEVHHRLLGGLLDGELDHGSGFKEFGV